MSGLIEGGELVASLKRYHFAISLGGRESPCLGIGAVFTPETHRRRGLAARLLRQILAEEELPALLFSDVGTAYYGQFGFVELPGAETWEVAPTLGAARTPGAGSGGGSPPLGLREARAEDLPSLLKWYRAGLAEGRVRLPRSEPSWRLFREINGLRDFVIFEEGRETGYVTAAVWSPSKLWIAELRHGGRAPASQVMAFAAAECGCAKWAGWTDHSGLGRSLLEGARQGAAEAGAQVTLSRRETAIPMLRPAPGQSFDFDLSRAHISYADYF
jgi:hypothetical protein